MIRRKPERGRERYFMQRTILCKWTRSLNSTYTFSTGIWISFWSALTWCTAIALYPHHRRRRRLIHLILARLFIRSHTLCSHILRLVRSFISQTADLIQNTHLNTCSVYYFSSMWVCVCVSAYWLSNFSISFRLFHFPLFVFIFHRLYYYCFSSILRAGWLALGGRVRIAISRVRVRVSAWLPGIFNIFLFIKFSYKNTFRICTL